MIAFALLILVKLDLEAVPAAVHVSHGAQGGVALCADARIFERFPVDHQIAGRILLALTGFDKAVPVVHHDIQRVHPRAVKNAVFIADRMRRRFDAERPAAAEHCRNHERDCDNDDTEPVDTLVC